MQDSMQTWGTTGNDKGRTTAVSNTAEPHSHSEPSVDTRESLDAPIYLKLRSSTFTHVAGGVEQQFPLGVRINLLGW